MPLYQYRCDTCNESAEYQKKMSEADNAPKCPSCKKKMKRLLASGMSFAFKGKLNV